MLGPLARISNHLGRNVMMRSIRNGSHGGVPGENLPFDIHNKSKITFYTFLYVGTGIAAPFLILQWQMMKK